jgi:hypothetical protein
VIVADTGAVVALIDAQDRHHEAILALYDEDPTAWILPWAILRKVDYVLGRHVGRGAAEAFHDDLADAAFAVDGGWRMTCVEPASFAFSIGRSNSASSMRWSPRSRNASERGRSRRSICGASAASRCADLQGSCPVIDRPD